MPQIEPLCIYIVQTPKQIMNTAIQLLLNTLIHSLFTKYKIPIDEFSTITIGDDIEASLRDYCARLAPAPVTTKKVFRKKPASVAEMLNSPTHAAVTEVTPVAVTEVTPVEVVNSKLESSEKPLEALGAAVVETLPKPIIGEAVTSLVSSSIEAPKAKKVIKKKAAEVAPAEATQVAPVMVAEVPQVAPAEIAEVAEIAPVVSTKPKKVIKKKTAETTSSVAAVETTTPVVVENTPVAVSVETETVKPKKVIKKKAAEVTPVAVSADVTTQIVQTEPPKAKKVIKKEAMVVVPESNVVIVKEKLIEISGSTNVTVSKIIKKKPVQETVEPAPLPVSTVKTVPVMDYAEEGEEPTDVYESLVVDEEEILEPREIDGVSYYVDQSGYVYDFSTKDIIGKFKEANKIIFLRNFTNA